MNVYGEEHDVQSHTFRPTMTDMQDKYCCDCYEKYFIKSQYTKVPAVGRATSFVVSFVLGFDGVNIVAVNAILVLHVGKTRRRTVGRTPLGLHVPSRCDYHGRPDRD